MLDPTRPTEVTSSSRVVLIFVLFRSFAGDAAILAVMLGMKPLPAVENMDCIYLPFFVFAHSAPRFITAATR
jgi:hypothetical protein